MRVTTFAGLVALYAVIGLCIVQETSRQTRAKYELARILEREEAARARLDAAEARVARLARTERLERLNEYRALGLRPLETPSAGEASP